MIEFLVFIASIFVIIILITLLNDKIFHLPSDIALVIGSLLLFAIVKIVFEGLWPDNEIFLKMKAFDFEEFLIDGILCFMIFAGASKISFNHFKHNFFTITIFSVVSTLISTFVCGGLLYLLFSLTNVNLGIVESLVLGAIISPTDPIAATSILKKAGLNKNVSSIIEGESLFNDGVGIAFFLCFKNMALHTASIPFPVLLLKEIFGALAVGFAISFILYWVSKKFKDYRYHIMISLLAVLSIYSICELVGFSGVIGTVVAGIFFSYMRHKDERRIEVIDQEKSYESFFESIDMLLNSILFVLVGYSIIFIKFNNMSIVIILFAIISCILARLTGVLGPTLFNRNIPNSYNKKEYVSLLTLAGLKGGLSLALALSLKESFNSDIYSTILVATFGVIIFSIVVQGLSIKRSYLFIERKKNERIKKEREKELNKTS